MPPQKSRDQGQVAAFRPAGRYVYTLPWASVAEQRAHPIPFNLSFSGLREAERDMRAYKGR